MTKYKLIDKYSSKKTIDKLNLFVYVHESIAKYEDISKAEIDALKNEIIVIEEFQKASPGHSLNTYLRYEHLTVKEVVFCLLGLDPNIIKVIKEDSLVYAALKETKEFEHLNRANSDEFISNYENKVLTKGFIKWMIENEYICVDGSIEESGENDNTNSQTDLGNITPYNKNRKSISDHNIKVTLEDYENWTPALGKSKNPNAFVNDSTAFNKLKPKLKPLLKEDAAGNQTIPTEDTVAQYIRDETKKKQLKK